MSVLFYLLLHYAIITLKIDIRLSKRFVKRLYPWELGGLMGYKNLPSKLLALIDFEIVASTYYLRSA